MDLAVGLLEFISELARIIAFSFRLFGNIFAGEVLLLVMAFLVPVVLPMPFYGFEIFVGFIQAFVFAMLTMAFIAIAVIPHGAEHGENGH
jgi:F-type H+-transporting ATPase subunit a